MTVPSYPAPGYPASGPSPRPTTVTVATYLLYLVAAIEVISGLIVFITSGKMSDAVGQAYTGTEAEGAESIVSGVFVAGGVINLLIGLGFAALSFFNSRGKRPSRIVTWVVGGISLCCLGTGLGGNALFSGMGSGTGSGTTGPSQAEVQRQIEEALPSWYTPVTVTLAVVGLISILAVVILLALPASNEFFRKRVATGWDPAAPYPPPYPGYGQSFPGQPAPGQPYPGQQYPGQQPYPGQPQPGQYPNQPFPGQQYPGQQAPGPSYPAPQGQPGQPAPGLPPYPGQTSPPPASDPYGRPPGQGDDQPPRPPTDPV